MAALKTAPPDFTAQTPTRATGARLKTDIYLLAKDGRGAQQHHIGNHTQGGHGIAQAIVAIRSIGPAIRRHTDGLDAKSVARERAPAGDETAA